MKMVLLSGVLLWVVAYIAWQCTVEPGSRYLARPKGFATQMKEPYAGKRHALLLITSTLCVLGIPPILAGYYLL